jgi:hypothetical protein
LAKEGDAATGEAAAPKMASESSTINKIFRMKLSPKETEEIKGLNGIIC